MSFLVYVKKNLTKMPYSLGSTISKIPYDFRPGLARIYRERKKDIQCLKSKTTDDQKKYIFENVRKISLYAFSSIPFYQKLYAEAGVNPNNLRTFADLKEIPVITKADLQKVDLEYRSAELPDRSIVNTGGSSGNPLELYIEPRSIPHEWAHMHHIWAKLGFKQSDLKIVFGGRADVHNLVEYDSARHQLSLDIYSGWSAIADRLLAIYDRYKPKYLHGYPSSIFDFVIWLDINQHPLLPVLRKHIKGIFLGSEYPSPDVRQQVESLLDCKSVSWYGHTERSVLAYEKSEYGNYYPFLSYGFAEAIEDNDGSRLICTSYYNHASPLIRYDTGDLIEPSINDGILESFRIQNGRNGEFIIDNKGNKIFLTGLIFGRHHQLFDHARHIQIHQSQPGRAVVLVVPRSTITPQAASELFDSSNVSLDFDFKILEEPKRTPAGKVPLLVKEAP